MLVLQIAVALEKNFLGGDSSHCVSPGVPSGEGGRQRSLPALPLHGRRERGCQTANERGRRSHAGGAAPDERNRRTIRGSQCLIVEGVLQKESGCIDLIMKRCWSLDAHGSTDKVRARNFQ